jgi:site-specific recombinase XerD
VDTAGLSSPRLLDVLRREIRARHMSLRTEDAYVYWARDFIRYHGRRHSRDLGPSEVEADLSILANQRRVAASTHNQALSALLFLYRAVLKVELPWLQNLHRPKRPQRLPVVLTVEKVTAVLARTWARSWPARVRRGRAIARTTWPASLPIARWACGNRRRDTRRAMNALAASSAGV